MIKKAFQIVATAALLMAGYVGYTRGFTTLAVRVKPHQPVPILDSSSLLRSKTAEEADELAAKAFGPRHWSVDPDQSPIRFYNHDRGYWIYAKSYSRSKDGKRWSFRPFALVWRSKDGKELKTLTANESYIDFDRPVDMTKPGAGAARVEHARIDGDVRIRDDKGTLATSDDLTIGPLTYLEFDGHNDRIFSESAVVLHDRDLHLTGIGLQIDLRQKEGPAQPGMAGGYTGARAIYLQRKVRIKVSDVGHTGLVPGANRETLPSQAAPARKAGPTPGLIQSEGESSPRTERWAMRIQLPPPRPKVICGPPMPSEPTYADFTRNVRVQQGDPQQPDQIDADDLHLILLPADELPTTPEAARARDEARAKKALALAKAQAPTDGKDAPTDGKDKDAPAEPAPADDDGPLTGLALVRAVATGHAVWLQSPTQGTRANGNELIYDRHAPVAPDVVYFRGTKYIDLEKDNFVAQGADKGMIQSIDRIRTTDVTIHQLGRDPATVVAHGPGRLETRAAPNKPIERSATWRDKLEIRNVTINGEPRRQVTLFGDPSVDSPTQGSLQARDTIVAFLKPKEDPQGKDGPKEKKAPAEKPDPEVARTSGSAGAAADPEGDAMRIEWLVARGDVRMQSAPPAEGVSEDPDAPASRKTIFARSRLDVIFAEAPAPAPAPASTAIASPSTALAQGPNPAAPKKPAAPAAKPEEEEAKEPEPNLDVKANVVWAQVQRRPGGQKFEVQKVFLREDVSVHQDPAPGKERGTDAEGAAADVYSRGPGRMLVELRGDDNKPAIVSTDEMTIRGPDMTFNQANDIAEVHGPGRLTQRRTAPRVAQVADGKEVAPAPSAPGNGPMDITWTKQMKFFGRPADRTGQPGNGRAEFYENVRAVTSDSVATFKDQMFAFMDRPVPFNRPARGANDRRPAASGPKAQVVRIEGRGDAEIINLKLDNEKKLEEKRRLVADGKALVTYFRPTGEFQVDGPGTLYYYGYGKPGEALKAPRAAGNGPKVGGVASNGSGTSTRLRPAISARTKGSAKAADKEENDKDKEKDKGKKPLQLTQVRFEQGMKGKAPGIEGEGKDKTKGGKDVVPKDADLYDVQVLRAVVADEYRILDRDRLPEDAMQMTSQTMHVTSEPAPPGSDASSRILLDARGDAHVQTSDKAIQGDRITHDSYSDLFFIYGDPHEVIVADQKGVGQTASYGSGRVLRYNQKTGDMQLSEAQNFQFVDANSGRHANPVSAPVDKPEEKPKRQGIRPPGRSDKERRGFGAR